MRRLRFRPAARASLIAAGDHYAAESEAGGHAADEHGGFDPPAYHPGNAQFGTEEEGYYEDGHPPKRRMGIMAIAAVFALAVIGTAGAFGYRAIFGGSRSSSPPPVIKADTAPSKIVPAAASKTPNKLIYDRVADHAQDEKLVSREEKPVEIKTIEIQDQPGQSGALRRCKAASRRSRRPAAGSSRPSRRKSTPSPSTRISPAWAPTNRWQLHRLRRHRCRLWLRPDRRRCGPPAIRRLPLISHRRLPPASGGSAAAPPAQHTAAAVSRNAPLSLNPNAAPERTPSRTAAVAPPAAATTHSGGGYAVQVSSQRSEAEAQAAFRSLQAKFPKQLGGRQALIHKVDLGAKGTYYRAMVGPFANANEAGELCSGLKAAGGQCLIQRN